MLRYPDDMRFFFSAIFLLFVPLSVWGEEPRIMNDAKILRDFKKQLGAFGDRGGYPTRDELGLETSQAPARYPLKASATLGYADAADGVYLLGSVYKCDSCDDWHIGSIATAWALDSSGILVTNAHVLSKGKGSVMGVLDRNGKAYPVTAVLAANAAADIAIFQVEGSGLESLAVGPPASVGSRVRVISHPQQRFFMETFGDVSRYFRRPGRADKPASTWMTITADYAKGSSGGPVLDEAGRVVGMVASTQSIYYKSRNSTPEGPLQMVVKNTVPVATIAAMIAPAKVPERKDETARKASESPGVLAN